MAKDRYEIDFSSNPTFNTVIGLTNTTFDIENIVSGRGATEDQLAYVYGLIKALQDWLDENGCSDDPYIQIRQKVDELEAAINECCGNDQSVILNVLRQRIDDLEARIDEGCNNDYSGDTSNCDGNVITVSFGWNGDPFTDGGQATAVSADTSRQIIGYQFLVYDTHTGIYRRSSVANGGDWRWTISSSGSVTASHVGAGEGLLPFAKEIIAIDSQGCEGGVAVSLPRSNAVGG